ncbi:hypothetical protein MHH28_09455 [Paenibacillus sp. FSL K6-1217]|uniref:hypothetical protein n=1 Tax=Paenibacillus sp. FSL K6-1217 TaxID=2921466 RepID=UPI003246AC8C
MGMQQVLKDVIKETIAPLLKGAGFMRRGNNFAHICFNTEIYMEELYPKPSFPTVVSSFLQIRGTELTNMDN